MMTAAQLRAARGLLDWTRADLAKAAEVSPETIKNIEHGTFRPQEATTAAIIKAFTMHDVEFIENEGVRKRRDSVVNYHGHDEFCRFFDDVYETIRSTGDASICISGVDEKLFQHHLGNYHDFHAKRMVALKELRVRSLIREGDTNFVCSEYCDYRWVPSVHFRSVPFYVYGEKLAIITFHEQLDVNVAVINSQIVAGAYREQFEIMWNESIPPVTTNGK